eukprot:4063553-Prymnesium_polylepis.1
MRHPRCAAAYVLWLAAAAALYEEPPGGCRGPPDDFIPPPRKTPPPAAQRNMYQEPPGGCQGPADDHGMPPPRKRTVPPAPTPKTADETAEELERQLYEQESADMMQLPEEDWDEFERQHNRELFVRLALKVIAASLTM